jgi:hypothetical protein
MQSSKPNQGSCAEPWLRMLHGLSLVLDLLPVVFGSIGAKAVSRVPVRHGVAAQARLAAGQPGRAISTRATLDL